MRKITCVHPGTRIDMATINAQAPSDALRPWREPTALNCQFGAQLGIAGTASVATDWGSTTIAIAFRPRLLGQSSTQGLIANSRVGLAGGLGVRISNANLVTVDSADSWTVSRAADSGLPFPDNFANVPAGPWTVGSTPLSRNIP